MLNRIFVACLLFVAVSSPPQAQALQLSPGAQDLVDMLEEVSQTEQTPIRLRDSLMTVHGVDHPSVQAQQDIYETNHAINEKLIRDLLDSSGWPDKEVIGGRGNVIIANVIQHSSNDIRLLYLPMMQQEVTEGNLQPGLLARAEDRIATERGDLQIYGGQMKYYPDTQTFNVWPVFDPANIDARRAAIGLGPIADHLRSRFNFKWDLEEQLGRTREFRQAMNK